MPTRLLGLLLNALFAISIFPRQQLTTMYIELLTYQLNSHIDSCQTGEVLDETEYEEPILF